MNRWKLVLASANADKVAEIASILGRVLSNVDTVPRPASVPEVIEDADSLLGNARLKACALRDATGMAAVADDTGLFVDALDGAPGVYSARFAGPDATYADNCAELRRALALVGALEPDQRGATFRTVALVAWPDGTETWAEGRLAGRIALGEQGSGGFGYDPLFIPTEFDGHANDRSFAELSREIKNRISHRALAFAALAIKLSVVSRSQSPAP